MPKLVISDARKADFKVCPHTKRFINAKPNHKVLRKNLEAGRVVIILSGPFAGKRAVFIRQLENGHALLNGPFGINEVPLCAVPTHHLIITSSKMDCKVDTTGMTFTMFTKPKAMDKKQQEEFTKATPAWLAEWQKKVDAAMVPAVPKEFVDYMKAPFVVRPQDKVHQFKF
ncbi:60S_ribosomal protein [Hexamita inflata]|uniref:60S ribosomal protein n=1 Tax=Hexamita inflata TaxID=28002 RepID=A0AA86QZS3_9EUKA|nr:60S ribosomal protein [Hexamita inflata]CAI9956371.1 60S ribosomal protein [Hexamita inflata]CAI9966382.1 60S ribosomal protein [Hexamita inflata]